MKPSLRKTLRELVTITAITLGAIVILGALTFWSLMPKPIPERSVQSLAEIEQLKSLMDDWPIRRRARIVGLDHYRGEKFYFEGSASSSEVKDFASAEDLVLYKESDPKLQEILAEAAKRLEMPPERVEALSARDNWFIFGSVSRPGIGQVKLVIRYDPKSERYLGELFSS